LGYTESSIDLGMVSGHGYNTRLGSIPVSKKGPNLSKFGFCIKLAGGSAEAYTNNRSCNGDGGVDACCTSIFTKAVVCLSNNGDAQYSTGVL
jgi:hypothetical protein